MCSIVFVHGISGNRESTWTKNGVLWSQVLLTEDFPEARILTAGYGADVATVDIEHELLTHSTATHAAEICDHLVLLGEKTNSVSSTFPMVSICLRHLEATIISKLTMLH